MKVHLVAIHNDELMDLFRARAAFSTEHSLVENPADAALILLVGNFASDPDLVLRQRSYREFPEKCAAYSEDDRYLPLLPGVYCSASIGKSVEIGRAFSYSYVKRNGAFCNIFFAQEDSILSSGAKNYMFSFQGGSTSIVRKKLFNFNFGRVDILIQNTSAYHHWDFSNADRYDWQSHYARTIAASEFVLCPRGAGLGSFRLFEVMAAGVAPVLISDRYVLPVGPAWDAFLIRVAERDIFKLPTILADRRSTAAERGRLARQAFLDYFSLRREFDSIVRLAALSLRHGAPAEEYFRRRQAVMVGSSMIRVATRSIARSAALRTMGLLRIKNPYQLAREE
jgi:hypothetical protein